jgi:hypothetical protein
MEETFLCGPCRGYITRTFAIRVEAGSNTSTVTLRVVRGDEIGSLKFETVKYGHESRGTRTREWLHWRDPVAIVNDRPVLSSERAPHKRKDRNCQTAINIWSWAPDGARHQDLLTDRQSQCDFDFVRSDSEGGFEYLHRSSASRRRRRKGNPVPGGYKYRDLASRLGESRIWDSKIWSWVPRYSDLRMTALARTNSNCKRQTHPLLREDSTHQQTRSCLTVTKISSAGHYPKPDQSSPYHPILYL